eukprot:Gb_34117 [translate_table: standard]
MQSLKQIVQSHFLVYDRLFYQWMLGVLAIWIGGRYVMRRLYGKLGTRGPKSWPVIGSSLELIANINNRYEWTTQYAKRFPTFEANFCFKKLVFTVDPAVGPGAYEINYDLLGDGIFNSDGEMWKIQRKTASLEFSSKILRDYSTNAFRKWGLKLASILQHEAHNMQPVNMQDMFMRMTFDSICEVGFGVEICSLSPSLPNVPFASAFDSCNSIIASRYGDPLWKFKKLFNIGMEAKLKEDRSVIDGFIYGIIQRRREAMKNNTEIKPDLLSRILSLGMENPNTYSDKYLRDAILSFIIAGRDTTAVTLSWFMFLLSKNPKPAEIILQELQQLEVMQCSSRGDHYNCQDGFADFAALLTYDNLNKLHYLHAAITETLRLYPAVPMDPKEAVGEDTLPNGKKIRRGNVVCYSPFAMGRMERLWGNDALEFKPERWLNDGVFRPQSPFKFTAFQAGPRICMGKDSAYLQMKMAAAILLRFFEFEVVSQHQVNYMFSLTLQMSSEGLPMRVKMLQ